MGELGPLPSPAPRSGDTVKDKVVTLTVALVGLSPWTFVALSLKMYTVSGASCP